MTDLESPSSPSFSAQSEEDDIALACKKVPTLSTAEADKFRNATVDEIRRTDVTVEGAVQSFFENRTIDCVNFLAENRTTDPLVMTGSGLIAFLRYMLSMEQEQADLALRDINEGSAFASQLLKPEKGIFSRIGSSFSMKKQDPSQAWLKPGEYRAKTVHTESQALRALVLILQGDVISFLKAGLALRRAYNGYKELYKEREDREAHAKSKMTPAQLEKLGDGEVDIGLDRNSLYSVDFGLGAINIAISVLPSSIMRMIKLLGFTGHRGEGVKLMRRCMESKTLLSPFASALLLGMFGALPLACSVLYESYSPHVRQVVQEALNHPTENNSLLHLWLIARAEFIHRDLDKSSKLMLRCVELAEGEQIKKGMPQLRNFVLYDLIGTHLLRHEWEKCRESFEYLLCNSKWSDIFYSYGQACCYEMMAFECEKDGGSQEEIRRLKERASQQYWLTVHKKATKMGGKVRATDQIFGKRLEEMLDLHGVAHPNADYKEEIPLTPMPEGLLLENTVPLPAYEIAVLFMFALRAPNDIMKAIVANIDSVLLSEKLVASQRGLEMASEERRLADEEMGRAGEDNLGEPVEELDDEENDEENFGDDSDERRTEQKGRKASTSTSASAANTTKHTETVVIPLQVVAINQANDAYRRTKEKRPPNGALPANYIITALSAIKAGFLANSELSQDRAKALPLINALLGAPGYKDKAWSLSYVQPTMLYEKACILFKDGDGTANCNKQAMCEEALSKYEDTYPDAHYYTHTMTEFRVHLVKCEFRNEKKDARAAAKAAKHADPAC